MKRLEELDSIRGIAACIVLVYHVLMLNVLFSGDTYGDVNYWGVNILKHTPLVIFFSGTEAVTMFFLLSGFVLSLPFYYGQQISYGKFLLKRICRIYLPYIGAICLAVILGVTFTRGGGEGYITGDAFSSAINFQLILRHILMIGQFDSSTLNPPIWSLIHEMRVSLIFPLIMFFVLKFNWKNIIPLTLALSLLGAGLTYYLPSVKFTISYTLTIHYMSIFIIGALLAKYKDQLIDFFSKRKKIEKKLVFLSGFLLMTYRYWFFYNNEFIHNFLINEWMVTLGASIIIVSSLSFSKISKVLQNNYLKTLGKISYSVYLMHVLVVFFLIKTIGNELPFFIVGAMMIVLSLVVGYLYSISVEEWAMKLGKSLTGERRKSLQMHKSMKNIEL